MLVPADEALTSQFVVDIDVPDLIE